MFASCMPTPGSKPCSSRHTTPARAFFPARTGTAAHGSRSTPRRSSQGTAGDGLNRGLWGRAWMYVDYLQVLWGRFVAGLNYATQQEAIYQPLAAMFARVWRASDELSAIGSDCRRSRSMGLIGRSWTGTPALVQLFWRAVAMCASPRCGGRRRVLARRLIRQLRRLARRVAPGRWATRVEQRNLRATRTGAGPSWLSPRQRTNALRIRLWPPAAIWPSAPAVLRWPRFRGAWSKPSIASVSAAIRWTAPKPRR